MNKRVSPTTPAPGDAHTPKRADRAHAGDAGPGDGRRRRWAAHRVTRREDFITAAIIAIGRHGATVGMDQIASVAKTSKPVIYRYFADKDDLYQAVSQRVVGQVLAALLAVTEGDPAPRELIYASVDAYLQLLEAHPELYRFVAQHPLIAAPDRPVVTDFSTVVAAMLGRHLEQHLDALDLNPALAHPWAESIVGFITAASLWWLEHRDAMTRAELANYLGGLLWGGAAGVVGQFGSSTDLRIAAT